MVPMTRMSRREFFKSTGVLAVWAGSLGGIPSLLLAAPAAGLTSARSLVEQLPCLLGMRIFRNLALFKEWSYDRMSIVAVQPDERTED